MAFFSFRIRLDRRTQVSRHSADALRAGGPADAVQGAARSQSFVRGPLVWEGFWVGRDFGQMFEGGKKDILAYHDHVFLYCVQHILVANDCRAN